MSAGNLALIACVPGLGLMLLAVEASKKKKSKGPGSDFIRMIESMGITRSSSNCESSEWGCSSTSKQPTLQHDNHMGWGTPKLCPVSRETWTGPVHIHQCSSRAPQATKYGQCQHQSAGSCSQVALPCHGKALCYLLGCWSWAKQGPGGVQCVRGEERGWTLHHLPDHRTSMPGALTRA